MGHYTRGGRICHASIVEEVILQLEIAAAIVPRIAASSATRRNADTVAELLLQLETAAAIVPRTAAFWVMVEINVFFAEQVRLQLAIAAAIVHQAGVL